MRLSIQRFVLLAISAYATSGISTAGPINGAIGISMPAFTQNFEGTATALNSQIGAQFGNISSTTLFYDANPSCGYGSGDLAGNCVANFQYNGGNVTNVQSTFSILFGAPQNFAEFAMISGGLTNDTFTALYNGNVVDTFTTNLTNNYGSNGNFYGFTGETFDTIQVAVNSGSNLAVIDNIQFTGSSVPEPGTLALFGLGLVGVGFYARKRRSA